MRSWVTAHADRSHSTGFGAFPPLLLRCSSGLTRRLHQRKLYQKAKGEPSYRFYLLYDKMHREDFLAHAYALVKSNQGAPGVDGQSFWAIESQGLEEWLSGIRDDLRAKTYQPQAVRRVMIP